MNNLGKGEESEEVKEQRSELERCITTEAAEGFKIGVCDNFIERIEKTVYVGEVPENKLSLTKIDNTANNSVEGFVRDVTYELGLPLVVKQEKVEKLTAEDDDDDDDLRLSGTQKPLSSRSPSEKSKGSTITTSSVAKESSREGSACTSRTWNAAERSPRGLRSRDIDRWNSCERSRSIWNSA